MLNLLRRGRAVGRRGASASAFVLGLCVTLLLLVVGCERQIAPPLVDVTELAPRTIETGDRLEVHGAGFPQGRTGHVVLDGNAFRPGEPPRALRIEADGTVVSSDRLEIVVREPFTEQLCGRGERGAHATFRGRVSVAFASLTPGAPPLVGVLREATFDVLPSAAAASVAEGRAIEGARLLAHLGITPGPLTPRGLPIEQVAVASPAHAAGVQIGDVLTAVDGVHVLALSDVAPVSARGVDLTIRHGDTGGEETKTFALLDYSGQRVPAEYVPALVIVGLAIAILLLLVVPAPAPALALELRIAAFLRRASLRDIAAGLFGRGREAALSVILSAIAAVLALTPWVVGREVDGIALLAGAASMLVASRIACGGRDRGLLGKLLTLVRTAPAALGMLAAATLTIGQVGAIELAEIVRAQGAAPWQCNAARQPAATVLSVVYGAAIVDLLRVRPAAGRTSHLERAGLFLAASLGTALFFGGWQLPGVAAPRTAGPLALAAIVFVVKAWTVTAVLLGASRTAPRLEARELPRLAARRLVPALVLATGLVAASRRLVPSAAVETAIGATLVAMAALFVLRVAARVRTRLARPEPHASPFL